MGTFAFDTFVSASFLGAAYCRFAAVVQEPRRRAWFLTLVCATVVGCGGLAYAVPHAGVFSAFDAPATRDAAPQTANANPNADAAPRKTLGETALIVLDLLCSAFHYRQHTGLLVGWVHHVVYWCFFAALYRRRWTVAGSTTLVMELPTALLALGHCFPNCRRDLAYGALFFTFRVFYNAVCVYHYVRITHDPAGLWPSPSMLWPCPLATLALHTHWFYKWYCGYARRLRGPKAAQKEAKMVR